VKKKILLTTVFFAVAALAVTVCFNVNSNKGYSDLTLANIEALACGHIDKPGDQEWTCPHCGNTYYSEHGTSASPEMCWTAYSDGSGNLRVCNRSTGKCYNSKGSGTKMQYCYKE